jgi:hypothetical protein
MLSGAVATGSLGQQNRVCLEPHPVATAPGTDSMSASQIMALSCFPSVSLCNLRNLWIRSRIYRQFTSTSLKCSQPEESFREA